MSVIDYFQNATVSAVVSAIVAWLANQKLQYRNWRELRHTELMDIFAEIRSDATVYWMSTGQDKDLERSLVRLSTRCRSRCLRFDKKFSGAEKSAAIKARCLALHNALTGGSFQTANRASDPNRLQRVKSCVDELESQIGLAD